MIANVFAGPKLNEQETLAATSWFGTVLPVRAPRPILPHPSMLFGHKRVNKKVGMHCILPVIQVQL
jgi:hypothetical protein